MRIGKKKKYVVEPWMVEMCKCGHERLCHTDTYEKGHGHCIANVKATQTPCECIKFTYISSIHLSKSIN